MEQGNGGDEQDPRDARGASAHPVPHQKNQTDENQRKEGVEIKGVFHPVAGQIVDQRKEKREKERTLIDVNV